MRILVLDTALGACQAGLAEIGAEGEARLVAFESQPMTRGHAEALMPMLERVLAEAGGARPDRVAAITGPGSFTGLRVAVSAARALALAWNVRHVGVTSLAGMATRPARESGRQVAALVDARRGEAYWQAFGPDGVPRSAPAIDRYEEIALRIAGEADLVGTGAGMLAALEPGRFRALDLPPWPDLAETARLAARAQTPARPLYIRAPDAKLPDPRPGLVPA